MKGSIANCMEMEQGASWEADSHSTS